VILLAPLSAFGNIMRQVMGHWGGDGRAPRDGAVLEVHLVGEPREGATAGRRKGPAEQPLKALIFPKSSEIWVRPRSFHVFKTILLCRHTNRLKK
jgi:hypothetical protein